MGIRLKVALIFGVLFLFTVALGANGLYQMRVLSQQMEVLYNQRLQAINTLNEVRDAANTMRFGVAKQMLTPYQASKKAARQSVESKIEIFQKYYTQYKAMNLTPEEQKKVKEIDDAWASYSGYVEGVMVITESGKESVEMFNSLERDGLVLQKLLNDLTEYNTNLAAQQKADAEQRYRQSLVVTVALALLTSIACFVGLLVLRFLVVQPVQRLEKAMAAMARGDLRERVEVRSRDELGRLGLAFNQMAEQWKSIVTELQELAKLLNATSAELGASAEMAATTTGQVAAAIERTAENATEQSEYINLVVKHVREATRLMQAAYAEAQATNQLAQTTSQVADNGRTSVEHAILQSAVVMEAVENARRSISALASHSESITRMTTMIGAIANQTNLLALNAAIEAARAGEHGKGFAVVASEVRKLAEQSQQSAGEIERVVSAIQHEINQSLAAMEQNVDSIAEQNRLVAEGGLALEEIAGKANETKRQVGALQERLSELVATFRDVEQRMELMGDRVSETAANAEEVSASSEEITATVQDIARSAARLSEQADMLKRRAGRFTCT